MMAEEKDDLVVLEEGDGPDVVTACCSGTSSAKVR
jgi:hypothetical protein